MDLLSSPPLVKEGLGVDLNPLNPPFSKKGGDRKTLFSR